jgi:hypothetical protein
MATAATTSRRTPIVRSSTTAGLPAYRFLLALVAIIVLAGFMIASVGLVGALQAR